MSWLVRIATVGLIEQGFFVGRYGTNGFVVICVDQRSTGLGWQAALMADDESPRLCCVDGWG